MAIMALDDSRLGVENKFLEKKSRRVFAFDKFTLQNLANKSGCVQTNLFYFLYIISEVKEYYEALFLSYRPQTIGSQFHNFQDKLHSFNIQDHRSTRGLLAKPFKNLRNHLYGKLVLIFDKRKICREILKELRFNIIKDLLCLFFIDSFMTMCNLKKRFIRAAC